MVNFLTEETRLLLAVKICTTRLEIVFLSPLRGQVKRCLSGFKVTSESKRELSREGYQSFKEMLNKNAFDASV